LELLLDTHALIWWIAGDFALSSAARSAIDDPSNNTFVSAASAWEITTKYRIGKLPGVANIVGDLGAAITGHGFTALAVTLPHAAAAGALPGLHKDPFDRMLIAQALLQNLSLVSNERVFDSYGVQRLW